MYWLIILLLIAILVFLYFKNSKMKKFINDEWSEILTTNVFVLISVFIGAFLALQLTKELNQDDKEKNYLSMLNSCLNMNERYIKKFENFSENINPEIINYSELNRFITNINQPFLLEELIKNSDLYECSSINFRNWLPDIISFIKETNWTISGDNTELINYNKRFLLFLKEILKNEKEFSNKNLSEDQLACLNNKSRLKHHISTRDIPVSDIIILFQMKQFADSLNVGSGDCND